MDNISEESGSRLEKNYVRSTYDIIATEFSNTRYKKWPKVEAFLQSLPRDSLLLDVGCGNGKYLDNTLSFSIGCDASSNLLSISKGRGFETVLCDMTQLPFRRGTFDAIICVAALHHIVTEQRRQRCLEDMANLLTANIGRLLVQVWSYEQELDKDNPYLKRDRTRVESDDKKEEDVEEVGLDGSIRIPVHKNRTPFKNQDLLVPFNVKQIPSNNEGPEFSKHLRYYHVFKKGELDSMIEKIELVHIVDSYYDRGNWCAIARRSET